jgi:hypothetical protein
MTRSTLSFVFAALTTTAIAGENFLVYFGTNTNAKNGSKGIYVARFNSASGELTQPELAAEAGNPGFLAIHPSKKYLYAIGDVTMTGWQERRRHQFLRHRPQIRQAHARSIKPAPSAAVPAM